MYRIQLKLTRYMKKQDSVTQSLGKIQWKQA